MEKEKMAGWMFLFTFLFGFLTLFIYPIIYYSTGEVIEITVDGKENVNTGETGKYLIYTENEVFENTDLFWKFKYNSSDIYNDIKINEKYKVKVYGWRIPFFSMYRNIYSIEKL